VKYDIALSITYTYDAPAVGGRNVLRMMPQAIAGVQSVIAASQTVTPRPKEWVNRTDFFGNPLIEIAFDGIQSEIDFAVMARVDCMRAPVDGQASVRLDALGEVLTLHRELDGGSPHHFLAPSQRIVFHPDMTAYARTIADTSQTVFELGLGMCMALYREMRFDPESTHVDTHAIEAFTNRHGVCQDFSHIMITALRGIGIPAGYVSGFLRTDPPPGKPRLEGADAMHAWVQVWCGPALGWVEFDPTNGVIVGQDHIVIARGRDYSDVSPVKGQTRTAGGQKSEQKVTVRPLS